MWVEEEQEAVLASRARRFVIFKTRERKEAAVYVLVSRLLGPSLVTHHVISVTKCREKSGGGGGVRWRRWSQVEEQLYN